MKVGIINVIVIKDDMGKEFIEGINLLKINLMEDTMTTSTTYAHQGITKLIYRSM